MHVSHDVWTLEISIQKGIYKRTNNVQCFNVPRNKLLNSMRPNSKLLAYLHLFRTSAEIVLLIHNCLNLAGFYLKVFSLMMLISNNYFINSLEYISFY